MIINYIVSDMNSLKFGLSLTVLSESKFASKESIHFPTMLIDVARLSLNELAQELGKYNTSTTLDILR